MYSFDSPLQLMHEDIRFFTPSVVDRKYWLLIVEFFTSKIYTYSIKKEPFEKKMELLYQDLKGKRDNKQALGIQTDREFNQDEIKKN